MVARWLRRAHVAVHAHGSRDLNLFPQFLRLPDRISLFRRRGTRTRGDSERCVLTCVTATLAFALKNSGAFPAESPEKQTSAPNVPIRKDLEGEKKEILEAELLKRI